MLETQSVQFKKTQDDATKRIEKLEETYKNQLELLNQIEKLNNEISTLRGKIDELNFQLEGAQKRQKDMYIDLDTRLRKFEPNSASATPVPPGTIPAVNPSDPSAEQKTYESAQQLRRNGNFQESNTVLQNFLRTYPKSNLAASAQYWIGDNFYNLKDYKTAILAQQRLISTYSDSPKVPDAMLNIASSLHDMGDTASSRKAMEEIVRKYPLSDAADKARKRLGSKN